MANREYIPPPVYGPTPPSPEQMEREADELVKRVQDAMDKRQVAETVTTVDPWELLRELIEALNTDNRTDGGRLMRALEAANRAIEFHEIDAALKQHDEEKS